MPGILIRTSRSAQMWGLRAAMMRCISGRSISVTETSSAVRISTATNVIYCLLVFSRSHEIANVK